MEASSISGLNVLILSFAEAAIAIVLFTVKEFCIKFEGLAPSALHQSLLPRGTTSRKDQRIITKQKLSQSRKTTEEERGQLRGTCVSKVLKSYLFFPWKS